MTDDMMSYYHGDEPGGETGLLPDPYYWWEAGAMFGALIDYWYYTGDAEYNNVTTRGLLSQVGPYNDYMPPSQKLTEGNDDQGFWGLAVMSAAEFNYPNPPEDQPQWLALAQAVFNTQAARWDMEHCNGGLRWQIFNWNKGFNYKNSISMACFFALAARLALYTGNESYADWADKSWDWMIGTGFMNPDSYFIYDGAHIEANCTDIVPYQWTYNAGGFLHGAAAMYNFTENDIWKERVDKLLDSTNIFFRGPNKDIMTEVACEPVNLCDIDQQSFKAYLSRWLAVTTKWAPWTYDTIMPWLRSSAEAAAETCVAGSNGRMCGMKWSSEVEGWHPDDLLGVGQQMAAMEILIANMMDEVKAPLSSNTGGTSQGDPSAGTEDIGRTEPPTGFQWAKIDAGDRVGGWMVTAVLILFLLTAIAFMIIDDWEREAWDRRKQALMGIKKRRQGMSLPWTEKPSDPLPPAPSSTTSTTARDRRRAQREAESSRMMADDQASDVMEASVVIGVAAAGVMSRVSNRRNSRNSGPHSFMAVGNDQATPSLGTIVPPVPAYKIRTGGSRPSSGESGSSTAVSASNRVFKSHIPQKDGTGIAALDWAQAPGRRNSHPKPQRVYLNRPVQHSKRNIVPELSHLVESGVQSLEATPYQHIKDTLPLTSGGTNESFCYTRNTSSPPGIATRTTTDPTCPFSPPRRSLDGCTTNQPQPSRASHPAPEKIGIAVPETSTPRKYSL
ncbi:putative glycoside hydrolase family 76 protein [Zalerion maritima]|uniref:mannan endo-1,6-alpha-mannosidase n=1 Tax=Zalerion maritima TaxID=339359 RepID=A0AAD5RYG9_9PEZI|nr:putative glycoside hydrolase family 76 protein [Zalerion maritima]